ncbi:hypothetical protein WA158_004301 [Blastocystis sp. Blastoise]
MNNSGETISDNCEKQLNRLENQFQEHINSIKPLIQDQIHQSLFTSSEFEQKYSIILSNAKISIEQIFQQLTTQISTLSVSQYSENTVADSVENQYIVFSFRDSKDFNIPLQYLLNNPYTLLSKEYKNRNEISVSQSIPIGRESTYFQYIYQYITTKSLDLSKFSATQKYWLYEEFNYFNIEKPLCLSEYTLNWLKTELWTTSSSLFLQMNHIVYTVNRKQLTLSGAILPFFNQNPVNIPYDPVQNIWTVNCPFEEINLVLFYINNKTIYLQPNDLKYDRIRSIIHTFSSYNIHCTSIWNQMKGYFLFKSSSILPLEYSSFISTSVGIEKDWKLLYRAIQDGFHSRDFHDSVDNKGECIIFIECRDYEQRYIFGGYTKKGWGQPYDMEKKNIGYKIDDDAFLFTIQNPFFIPPSLFPAKKNGYTIYDDPSWGPCFYSGFYISDECNENSESQISALESTFQLHPTLGNSLFVNTNKKSKSNHFIVYNVEVFGRI